ncbi:hypothetical protein VTO42DRAFT_1435 [Malbranchea cinnamomea]
MGSFKRVETTLLPHGTKSPEYYGKDVSMGRTLWIHSSFSLLVALLRWILRDVDTRVEVTKIHRKSFEHPGTRFKFSMIVRFDADLRLHLPYGRVEARSDVAHDPDELGMFAGQMGRTRKKPTEQWLRKKNNDPVWPRLKFPGVAALIIGFLRGSVL